ncbi:MAG: zinc-binding dehydrogenase, partial [Proteobacteria bacterium]|nr:zinc-binding dehydrogenase [Pseudomonadota bacterium]
GSDVSGFNIGDEVILNPSLYWGPNEKVHGPDYQILGFPTQGTFAEYISISSEYVYAKPKHLSLEEAAALPLAGLTAYRALFTRGGCVRDSKVLITGIGGGAALFALHFAVASGAQAYVTSSSHEKIRKAVDLGANGGVIYRNTDWDQELRTLCDGFDVIVDSAAGKGFSKLLDLAQPGASIAMFGRTAGNMENLSPSSIFWKQLSIHGTTMGTAEEFEAMLSLVSSKKIFPVIDSVYPARDIGLAFEKMEKAEQFGKIVINMEEL